MQHLQHPLTGFPAFVKFLEIAYAPGAEIWIKAGNSTFFVGSADLSGNFPINLTHGTGTERKRIKQYPDAYELLSAIARHHDGGALFIPGKPQGYPLKDYCHQSDLISAEMDNSSIDEQRLRLREFSQTTGLIPAAIVHSGNRSLHGHIKLSTPVDIPTRTFLARLLAIALQSDPAVTNPHQPMRIPGFLRKEKGKEQTLEFSSTNTYTVQEFIQGIQLQFARLGYVYHEQLSDERWRKLNNALSPSKKTGDCVDKVREILAAPEVQPKPKPQFKKHYSDNRSLSDVIDYDIYPRLTADMLFGDLARWSRPGRNCFCPFCTVKEKKPSFGVDDRKHLYHCFGCGAKGTWLQYIQQRHNLSVIDAVKLLASWVNVEIPKYSPVKSVSIYRPTTQPIVSLPEPDSEAYHEYQAWLQEQEEIESAQGKEWLYRDIKNLFLGIRNKLARTFRGFGQPPTITPPRPILTIRYVPGQLPTLDEWRELGRPKLIYRKRQRKLIWREALDQVFRFILDNSMPGLGKSHESGELHPRLLDAARLWHLSADHRNPTVASLERNFRDMPVRNAGLVIDPIRKTALGNPHIRWPKGDEETEAGNNCHLADLFHDIAEKGWKLEGEKTATTNAEGKASTAPNPICAKCKKKNCGEDEGSGFGFRAQRKAILGGEENSGNERIRSSPDSLPDPSDYPFGSDGALWDEIARIFKPIKTIKAQLKDFDKLMADLESKLPDVHLALRELRLVLRALLAGETKLPYHGLNDAKLRELLPPIPHNIEDLISAIAEHLSPNWAKVFSEADSVNMDGVVGGKHNVKGDVRAGVRRALATYRTYAQREAKQESKEKLNDLAVNWLIPLLQVWANLSPGALRVDSQKLQITVPDSRLGDIAKAMKFNIFMDATMRASDLALYLGCDDILVIEEEKPSHANLTLNLIKGFYKAGKGRAESTDDRIKFFVAQLKNIHKVGFAYFDHMSKAAATGADGYWFNHSRSSNEFISHEAIASFGLPYKNIGDMEDLWLTLTGTNPQDNPDFREFVEWDKRAEIIQAIGRLRAHLRPEQQLTYYFCADEDLSFLLTEMPGVTLRDMEAVTICPEAGTANQRNWWKIVEAIEYYKQSGEKVTQDAVAAVSQVAQSTISYLANGGFKKLSKLLLESTNSAFDNFQRLLPLLDEEGRLAAEDLVAVWAELAELPPTELAKATMELLEMVPSTKIVYASIGLLPDWLKARVLGALISILPLSVRHDLEEMLPISP